jgi:hypothetical protein
MLYRTSLLEHIIILLFLILLVLYIIIFIYFKFKIKLNYKNIFKRLNYFFFLYIFKKF